MTTSKIEMQDSMGNVLYPHTSGDLVNYDITKTVNQKIDEVMTNLASLKAGLATAVNNKVGSSLTSDSTIQEIANEVNSIVTLSSGTADANATAGQILSGSTAYVKGNKIAGSMTNNGTVTQTLNAGGSYTIPAGYHNGSGKVTANSLASQTSATAVAGDIISGKTAFVNGSKITGNITSKTATTYTPSTSNQIIPAGNYLSGDQTIKGDANLVGGNIISGKTIFGVAGTATSTTNVANLTLTDINLITTTKDGSGLIFTIDLSSYLNGLSRYIIECNGTCYAYSTSTVASYAVITPYSSFIKYRDSYEGDVFKSTVPDPTKIIFYRRTNSSYQCTSINFTVRITSF